MMEESTWYGKQRSQIDDALWRFKQRFRMLQEYRMDIHGLWRDDAASEINGRYFNPHEDDINEALQALQQHALTLQDADEKFELARQHGVEITNLLDEVEKYLNFSRQDVDRAHSEYGTFKDHNSAANEKLPIISQLLNQANNCC